MTTGGSEGRGDRALPHNQVFIVDRVARRVKKAFASLDSLPYLGSKEREDFRYYEQLFEESLENIRRKVREQSLRPLELHSNPLDFSFPGNAARIGIFIGSFDPFQMTHLAMALRFLASDESEADAVLVVPEGSSDPRKPQKTDYRFRFDILKRQLAGIFEPFVVPADLGEGADTIEIVRRLIALHPGASLRLTHLMGSDTLPIAARLLPEDLAAWDEAASRHQVALDFSIFVVRRDRQQSLGPLARAVEEVGVPMVVDRTVIGTPSSTAFRRDRAITLVFPTAAILGRLELLFRYGMNRSWSTDPDSRQGPFSDFEI